MNKFQKNKALIVGGGVVLVIALVFVGIYGKKLGTTVYQSPVVASSATVNSCATKEEQDAAQKRIDADNKDISLLQKAQENYRKQINSLKYEIAFNKASNLVYQQQIQNINKQLVGCEVAPRPSAKCALTEDKYQLLVKEVKDLTELINSNISDNNGFTKQVSDLEAKLSQAGTQENEKHVDIYFQEQILKLPLCPSPTPSPTSKPTPTPSPTPTVKPTFTPSPTPSVKPTPTLTPRPTTTPFPTPPGQQTPLPPR